MTAEKNLILKKKQVLQIVKRIAYEIYEHNYLEKELFIAGVYDRGYLFGKLLLAELEKFPGLKVRLIRIELNKVAKTQPEVALDVDIAELKNKTIIVTDDVLNTGRALMFGLRPFLSVPVKKLQIAVIVDRNHKIFPVAPDYIGYSLATTLKEHIDVDFSEEAMGVYLH
jgi:pyrimidine operon attenuation protein / uracil phosphoribosyltransferase